MNGLSIYTGALEAVGYRRFRGWLVWGEGYSGKDVGLPQNHITSEAKMDFFRGVKADPRVWINWHLDEEQWLFGEVTAMEWELYLDILGYGTHTADMVMGLITKVGHIGLGVQYRPTKVTQQANGARTLHGLEDVRLSITTVPAWEPPLEDDQPRLDTLDALITRAKELTG